MTYSGVLPCQVGVTTVGVPSKQGAGSTRTTIDTTGQ